MTNEDEQEISESELVAMLTKAGATPEDIARVIGLKVGETTNVVVKIEENKHDA